MTFFYICIDMLFGRRIGFSGTPSDILPLELGSCNYERGSDGRVVHYLTSPSVVDTVNIPVGWDVYSLLEYVATVSIRAIQCILLLIVIARLLLFFML